MSIYTTEITSDKIPSDNVIHQRLLSAYHQAKPFIDGKLLELGCGEGRGVELLASLADSYVGIDKIGAVIDHLSERYPDYAFITGVFPPFPFEDDSFDTIVTFQVIEHVKDDVGFLKEIHRVLKPGGKALITTPNIKMTISRNPWHKREYTGNELTDLSKKYFRKVDMNGIAGNEKVLEYYDRNRKSVKKIMRFDVLDLQRRLPARLLRLPYDILNRMNRNKLREVDKELVETVSHEDFSLVGQDEQNFDLFCVVTK